MIECKICGKNFKMITHAHLKSHNISSYEYKKRYGAMSTLSDELRAVLSCAQKGKKMGDNNPARRKEVREKISNSVKKLWDNGVYSNRINGMLGMIKELHPNWKDTIHTPLYLAENDYVSFLSNFQDVSSCVRCGSKIKKMNVHHIDEDHSNFLPSNLEPLCVPCHTSFHYRSQRLPFVMITKKIKFESSHFLPYYEGNCHNRHGHSMAIEVGIKKRIDTKTGMVLDFKILSSAMKECIVDRLNNKEINDLIINPTAENLLIWCWERLMFEALLKGIEYISIYETKHSEAKLTKDMMLSYLSSNIEEYVLK